MEKLLQELLEQHAESMKELILSQVKHRALQKLETGLAGRLYDIRVNLCAEYKEAAQAEITKALAQDEMHQFVTQALAEIIRESAQKTAINGLKGLFQSV